jgi:tRNA (guanine-N7-)-methyltransferase
MPRRALRKVDSSLDLTVFLKTFEQLPNPWNTVALFGRQAPLEVEVGTGKGLFLRSAAAADEDTNFLGMEIAAKYAQYAAAMLAKKELHNAVVAHGDGLRMFAELLPDNCLAAVHVYFPDPWWKKRHKKRRVMRETFLRDVQRTLVPAGTWHFWTDVEEYFHSTLDLIAACTNLHGPIEVQITPAEHDMDYRTHFERRMRKLNLPVYRAQYVKTPYTANGR